MFNRGSIREGMAVYSSDGEKLGKVLVCDPATFIIEKGFFFPKDYVVRYDDIADVSNDEVRLAMSKDALARAPEVEGGRRTEREEVRATSRTRAATEDVTVPVAEEELEIRKRERDAGEVRLHKEVVTEKRQIEVPVAHEEVRVEHVRPGEERPAAPGEATFEEKTVSMPLSEEEVEIRKRPVVKEEVRLRKDRVVEQRASEEEVRKEKVDVESTRDRSSIRDDTDS